MNYDVAASLGYQHTAIEKYTARRIYVLFFSTIFFILIFFLFVFFFASTPLQLATGRRDLNSTRGGRGGGENYARISLPVFVEFQTGYFIRLNAREKRGYRIIIQTRCARERFYRPVFFVLFNFFLLFFGRIDSMSER